MRLLLDNRNDENARLLKQELFKVEQYADLALKFVKLGDIAGDLVVELCDLNELHVRRSRIFSFVCVQQLSVEIEPLEKEVVSDSMWLGFILQQLLSNCVKYTHIGGVRIYMERGALVVSDTGIGIRKEDLPRIFEKGYTGYNGAWITAPAASACIFPREPRTRSGFRLPWNPNWVKAQKFPSAFLCGTSLWRCDKTVRHAPEIVRPFDGWRSPVFLYNAASWTTLEDSTWRYYRLRDLERSIIRNSA
jgi:hypothetical protein